MTATDGISVIMARVIPVSNSEIVARLNSGKTPAELAEEWGVQAQTVRHAARLAGWQGNRAAAAVLPWMGTGPAAHSPAARALRALVRINAGETLTERKMTTFLNWKAERDATNTVVMYDPEMGPNPASPTWGGFYYAPRKASTPEGVYYQE
jgi:hypothetical protein